MQAFKKKKVYAALLRETFKKIENVSFTKPHSETADCPKRCSHNHRVILDDHF